jgi:hypothetical protein
MFREKLPQRIQPIPTHSEPARRPNPVQATSSIPMRLLFIADLHYALKQFDWLVGQASSFDPTSPRSAGQDATSWRRLDIRLGHVLSLV